MRLAFLCGSLEPGRDGVGDYARRLAAEVIRQGHVCLLVALNDPAISKTLQDFQTSERTEIPTARLPVALPWKNRTDSARKLLDDFRPDWISFQFVPFGYSRKGFCFGLGENCANMSSTANWHLMFHELWLGLGRDASVKHRLWGIIQRRNVLNLTKRLQPKLVHTQVNSYLNALKSCGVKSSILPLFSNIPVSEGDAWASLLEPLIAHELGASPLRDNLYLAGVFGAVYPEWQVEIAVNALLPLVQQSNKRLVLVFLGRNHLAQTDFEKMKASLSRKADMVVAGERNDVVISQILQCFDLGLATTPRQVIQKSGSVAAMLEHGLPILVTRDDWHLRHPNMQANNVMNPRLFSPKDFDSFKCLPTRDGSSGESIRVKAVATRLLKSMIGLQKPAILEML